MQGRWKYRPVNDRQRRYRLGHYAETICVWHLRLRGYRVLSRRFKTPVGEVDIIARRRNMVAFIEVKARRTRALAMESVSPRQQNRIRRAAEIFLIARPALTSCDLRFDIMLVTPWAVPSHVMNAWRD
ncbi:MAG: YraN family protein [Rhodospirillales bacterium]|nr:YraN family protein [Rhodospirillales bacterium]